MWKRGLLTTVTTRRYSAKALSNTHESASITKDVQEKTKAALQNTETKASSGAAEEKDEAPKRPKTVLEQDEELRLKLEGVSGGGGGSGVEYEGGKAVGLKRGVRENMFRVI